MRSSARIWLIVAIGLLGACGTPSFTGDASGPRLIVDALNLSNVSRDALALPNQDRSIKFAVIGDSGRGTPEQKGVAAQMVAYRQRFDFRFVLMAGDNIYEGPATPVDYRLKFEEPYAALLESGVKFFAVLGNHDDPRQVNFEPFHMEGHRYYTFTPPVDLVTRLSTRARFFALDSTNLDSEQLEWLSRELERSNAEWKIALLHYPLYTSGRYSLQARRQRFTLESRFRNGGVNVAFSGHEHIYQRSHLQNGILYFISGGAGSLRPGDAQPSPTIARSYDRDYHFMLIEITDDGLFFQTITRTGVTVDAGALRRIKKPDASTTEDMADPR